PLECPFQTFKKEASHLKQEAKVLVLDFHAEVTSEKNAMGYFIDGEASAMVGTHTHVQTADERIFPGGLGYLSDAGMNGPFDSIIGMKKELILQRFLHKIPVRMEVAEGDPMFQGVVFRVDTDTGRCRSVER